MLIHFQICPAFLQEDFFYVFAFGCHVNQKSVWNGNPFTTLKGDHPKIIPVKFGEITSGLGEE